MCFDELNNDEWAVLAALVADERERQNRRGRPRAETRTVANAVLWIMTTGQAWSRLPARYPSVPTCRHRFEEWLVAGTLAQMINVLSDFGRTFACIPQAPMTRVEWSEAASVPDRLHGVVWKGPESWRTPAALTNACDPNDAISAMTRQLLSGPADRILLSSPASARANVDTRGQPDLHHGALWTNRAWSDALVQAYRGHTIHASAQPVQQLMYRACVQIVKDSQRIERSGLIGPRFADTKAAQQYALAWARQWIDRACATLAVRVNSIADRNVSAATRPSLTKAAVRHPAQEECDPVTDTRGDGAPSFTVPELLCQVG